MGCTTIGLAGKTLEAVENLPRPPTVEFNEAGFGLCAFLFFFTSAGSHLNGGSGSTACKSALLVVKTLRARHFARPDTPGELLTTHLPVCARVKGQRPDQHASLGYSQQTPGRNFPGRSVPKRKSFELQRQPIRPRSDSRGCSDSSNPLMWKRGCKPGRAP